MARPSTYTDDQILDAIENGATTPNKLLKTLDLKSKTTLITRLRRMRDDGLVTMVEHSRREGFRVYSERSVR